MAKIVRNWASPYTATSLKDFLADATLTLATCWKLIPTTGVAIGATSHTQDIVLDGHSGIVFQTKQGVIPSATDSEAGLGSAGLEVDAVFQSSLITEESVASGDWDNAFFEVFIINYKALKMGEMVMFAGYIGDVKTYGTRFRAEGRPLTAKATQQIGKLFVPKCIARNLGDSDCKVNLTVPAVGDSGVITVTGTTTGGVSNILFTDSSRTEADGYFTNGIVTFTSGLLSGRSSEVKSFSGGLFNLHTPMPRVISVGTTYTAIRGCDRLPETCKNVYANKINFRGFDKVPGLEKSHNVKPPLNG